MEKCDGTLEDYIKRLRFNMDFSRFLEISEKIARALYFMKKNKVIHRDIRPENIFMIGDDVRLSDFSVSNYEQDIAGSSGTRGYRAPELSKKSEKTNWHKCDIYSLGITLVKIHNLLYEQNYHDLRCYRMEELNLMLDRIKEKYLKALLVKMTNENPEKRPDIEAVIGKLHAIILRNSNEDLA